MKTPIGWTEHERRHYMLAGAHAVAAGSGRKTSPADVPSHVAEARGKLIAAAPDLLAACKSALHAVDTALCGTPGEHYFKAVKTALKVACATSIEDNLAVNVSEIKAACQTAHDTLHAAITKAGGQ